MVVDDDEMIRKLLDKRLKASGFEVNLFESAVAALPEVSEIKPDLIIMDVNMPGKDGYSACKEVSRDFPEIPVIFLTASGGVEDKIIGFESGGQDYISKPFHFEELLARINVALKLNEKRIKAVRDAEAYKNLSITDPLTQVSNRRYFDIKFKEELERASRTGYLLSCLMIDIDKFKKINDTYGHQTGDEVLKKVAATIKESIRAVDFVSRYGGEEFIVILSQTDLNGAAQMAERIRIAISNIKLPPIEKITASIGAATGNSKEIVSNADSALYKAKQNGRNRVEKYSK